MPHCSNTNNRSFSPGGTAMPTGWLNRHRGSSSSLANDPFGSVAGILRVLFAKRVRGAARIKELLNSTVRTADRRKLGCMADCLLDRTNNHNSEGGLLIQRFSNGLLSPHCNLGGWVGLFGLQRCEPCLRIFANLPVRPKHTVA